MRRQAANPLPHIHNHLAWLRLLADVYDTPVSAFTGASRASLQADIAAHMATNALRTPKWNDLKASERNRLSRSKDPFDRLCRRIARQKNRQ